ncbi:lysozyme inhibitor LprI family protein [Brevundimonas sp. SL161]|uniref:lysozyme inhibitor LprI family protein n=1 Tax=Brevundimonas sp. SL161 TaxID=2804613 RepID=UPI003CE9F266
MAELVQTLGLLVAGAAITTLGFLSKRFFTKASKHEEAALYSALTDLQAKMTAANVSFGDLDAFAARIRSKVREADTKDSVGSKPNTYWTQGEMNRRAYAEFDVEDASLAKAVTELEGLIGEDLNLHAAQEAWVAYRDREAHFAAAEYEGGSIQPLIRSSELAALTRERRARVEAMINDRRSRYG